METSENLYADVIIIGGGPAGSTLACLLAMDGRRVLVLEKDIHPREHVGESMVPANNFVFDRIGFLDKMDEAGYIHKEGVGWTAPRSATWKFVTVRTADFVPPDAPRRYSFNVERGNLDTLLLRHAFEQGAKVVQGAGVKEVLFQDDRATGVRVELSDGWTQDLMARVVVDATGRRCLLAKQLGLKRKDAAFNQYAIWSWFRGLGPSPQDHEGFVFFHFLGLERAWAWQIPLRDGITSIGVVTDKRDFQKSGKEHEEFFRSLILRNPTLELVMRGAERIRPWWIEADYSYAMETGAGPGWILIGDAFRFIDPIFSSGVDVAVRSAELAHRAITKTFEGGPEAEAFAEYEQSVTDGVDIWYDTVDLFYKLQQLFGRFARDRRYVGDVARALQGNPFDPVNRARTRRLLDTMRQAYEGVMSDPRNLLRAGALDPPAPENEAVGAVSPPSSPP
jgi:1H-pyrrole-2-carbonyl-[peptidyl-carrier protein] chlorinase